MPRQTNKGATGDSQDLFGDGWLERQLEKVVAELSSRPPHLRPALTGSRAATLTTATWLRSKKE